MNQEEIMVPMSDHERRHRPEEKETHKGIKIGIIVLLMVLSVLFARYSNLLPFQIKSLQTLDDKKRIVTELTALSAATATGIAAIPDDATTPVADQIAEFSSQLILVVVIILFEKFLVGVSAFCVFGILFPITGVIGIVSVLAKDRITRRNLKRLAVRFLCIGIISYTLVPISTTLTNIVDKAIHTEQLLEELNQEVEVINEEEVVEADPESWWESAYGKLKDIGDTVVNEVTNSVEFAKQMVSKFMDAVAALLLTCFVIPILVLFVYKWLFKLFFEMYFQIDRH